MTTEEGNKLIAEFMGYKFNAYPDLKHDNITKPDGKTWYYASWDLEEFNKHITEELPYHSSWDWLMPVVEKINGMAFDDVGEVGVVIYPGTTNVETVNDELLIEGFSQKEYILNTWHTVVEFIKWYNQIK